MFPSPPLPSPSLPPAFVVPPGAPATPPASPAPESRPEKKEALAWLPSPSPDPLSDAVLFWERGVGLPYGRVATSFSTATTWWQLVDGPGLRRWVEGVVSYRELAFLADDLPWFLRRQPGLLRRSPSALAAMARACEASEAAEALGFRLPEAARRFPRILGMGSLPAHLARWLTGLEDPSWARIEVKIKVSSSSSSSSRGPGG